MRKFFVSVSLFLIFICFPGPMMFLLQTLTTAELFARLNAQWFYPLAGVLWFYTIVAFAASYWQNRPKEDRIWIVDERYLDDLDGIPYYITVNCDGGVSREIDSRQKPIVVKRGS